MDTHKCGRYNLFRYKVCEIFIKTLKIMFISTNIFMMGIMWPTTQSYFHIFFLCLLKSNLFIIILVDVCNEVHEHIE